MTGFRLSLVFFSALCILMTNCSMFGGGSISWFSKKASQISSTLPSLPTEESKTYFNRFKESISSSSWNPMNKIDTSLLDKKNILTSTLSSLQNKIPNTGKYIKSFITNPAKDLVHVIGEPSMYYNSIKNTLKISSWNPLNKDWLSKKKNVISSFLHDLPFRGNGIGSYITGSSKKLFNRFVWNPLENTVSFSLNKILGFLPSFVEKWGRNAVGSVIKFVLWGCVVAMMLIGWFCRCMKHRYLGYRDIF